MLRVRRTRSYSVRQWVNKEEEETETTGVRRAELGRAGAGRGRFQFFHRAWEHCMRTHYAVALLPFYQAAGRQEPDAAMPPCVWRWHTGRGLPHLARLPVPLKRSASIRPSVGQSSAAGGGRGPAYAYMHAHTHRQKKTIQKPHNPSLSPSCPSLDMPLCLICPHILLYCPLLEANSSYPSLSSPLLSSPCVFSSLLSCCLLGVKKR